MGPPHDRPPCPKPTPAAVRAGRRPGGEHPGPSAGLDVTLTDDILDRIDQLVPPGTDIGTLDQAFQPPALANPDLRRRAQAERAAA
jgi:hypothetical protein